jgi:hypothetical protein
MDPLGVYNRFLSSLFLHAYAERRFAFHLYIASSLRESFVASWHTLSTWWSTYMKIALWGWDASGIWIIGFRARCWDSKIYLPLAGDATSWALSTRYTRFSLASHHPRISHIRSRISVYVPQVMSPRIIWFIKINQKAKNEKSTSSARATSTEHRATTSRQVNCRQGVKGDRDLL